MLPVAAEVKYNFQRMLPASYNVEGYGLLRDCRVFELYINDDTVGRFFLHSKVCFISYAEIDFRVEIETHIFKKSDYVIIDRKTGDKLGEYFLPNWTAPGLGKIGNISIGYETYECRSVLPDIREKLFNPSTWGQHKMVLANDITLIVYQGQEGKTTKHSMQKDISVMSGTIVSSNASLLLVLAGFYMLEKGIAKEEMVVN